MEQDVPKPRARSRDGRDNGWSRYDRGRRGSAWREEETGEEVAQDEYDEPRGRGASRQDEARGPDPLDDPRAPGVLRQSRPRGQGERSRDGRGGSGSGGSGNRRGYPDADRRGEYSRDGRGSGQRDGRYPPASAADGYDDMSLSEEFAAQGREWSAGRERGPRDRSGYGHAGPGSRGGAMADPRRERNGAGRGQDERMGRGSAASWDAADSMGMASWEPGRGRIGTWADGDASSDKPKGGRKRLVVTLLLVAVVLVGLVGVAIVKLPSLLGGGSSQATTVADDPFIAYTPGATPTALPQYKVYASTTAQYSVNYPQQWSVKNNANTNGGQSDYVDIFQQASPIVVFTVEQAQAFATLTDQQAIDAEVNSAKQQGQTFTLTANSTQHVTVGGAQWLRQEYDGTANGVKNHVAILSTHHGGRSYVIVMISTPDNFAKADSTYFQPMLKSFRFQK